MKMKKPAPRRTKRTVLRALPKPEKLGQLWRFDGYGPLSSQQPLVAAGDRLLGVAGSTLFAIDIFRGKEPVPDERVAGPGFPYAFRSRYGADPYLTAAAGVVYFMDGEELTALRLADGLPLKRRSKSGNWEAWEPPMLSQVTGLFAVNDKIIAIHIGDTGDAEVTGFTAVDGERAFGPVVISELSPGKVTYGEGAVFFVADGKLHAVNVDFGDARFKPTQGGVTTEPLNQTIAPCVAQNVVAAAGSLLHFFDVKTGAEVFTAIAPTRARDPWSTPILADKGALFIVSNGSEVLAVKTQDGTVAWRTPLASPGQPTLMRGKVLVMTDNRRMLTTLQLATGEVDRRMELPEIAGKHTPVVTNETVFIPDIGGSLEARPFARQHAAYFDGVSSCIDVQADERQFDFGLEDFTIEAWVRSSVGGEIVSSHVTEANSDAHGFRLNLGDNGELRVAIVDSGEKSLQVGRSRPTHANDGEWHHIALVRRDHKLLALLDGKSLDMFFRDDSQPGLKIGGKSALTIGACRAAAGKPAEHYFKGLIRELRIWDRALDVATVQNNRHVALKGNEPRLKGLWRLTEQQRKGEKHDPVNAVERHGARATFTNPASSPTDLTLDNSGFPYLLHEIEGHWPYAGTWAARGEQPVATAAAISNAAIAFGTSNALYGVRRADGRRLWQIDMPDAMSAPVAEPGRFLVMTNDDGLLGIDPATGEYTRIDAFAGLVDRSDKTLVAPAVSPTHIAAASPGGNIRIANRVIQPVGIRDVNVALPVRELTLGETHLYALCGTPDALKLVCVDLATGSQAASAVSTNTFSASREWVLCVRDGKPTRIAAANAGDMLQARAAPAGTITGIATRRDADLVVVGTDRGEVHAYAMSDLAPRWTARLPAARRGAANAVYAPTFDAAGRVCCTTASGTIAMLDPATGARVGLYLASQGIVTPATFAASTVYFGGADPEGNNVYRDGALHSVVFGDTMVLRLGLDELGAPLRGETHAVIDIDTVDAETHTLHLMDPSRSCIEAWVNVPVPRAGAARQSGGGVIGICPTQECDFDVNLEIDADGTLQYSARSLQRGKWKLLRVSAGAKLNDGAWHHIAVSRHAERAATVFIDGVPFSSPQITLVEEAPARTASGFKAYIGAAADMDLKPVRHFCGMIADVRVWDTFMGPAEIAARMHVKLRGNEPDLLAFWNFDRQNVDDAGQDHHNGKLVGAGDQPVWWLSDLAFEKPAYPYITTAARIIRNMPGEPKTYEVTCSVRRADGSGMAGQPLNLWYVRNRDDQPGEVLFNTSLVTGVRSADEPEPGAASADTKQRVYSTVTGSDGSVSFLVTPTRENHTPAIDLRAGFMARQERFHVNVLLNEQMLLPPTPPTLTVQCKLVQDYAYSSGGTIDESRDRSTWRTVLKITNPDGALRVGEAVSLWAEEQTKIEIAGRSHSLNKENSVELVTDSQGELVITSDATSLNAPTLMARAGYMHRNDRVVIAPDQELHRTLSTVQGADFTEKRATRWKPGMKKGEGEPLLDSDYAPHANKVAEAITTVMAAAKPADTGASTEARGDAHLLRSKARTKAKRKLHGGARLLADAEPMRQPERAAGSDRVVTFRTMGHEPLQPALDPTALREALDRNEGFVFEAITTAKGKKDLRFELLDTRAKVKHERGTATKPKPLLRGFFGDLWDGIKDVATDIYEGAVKVVVSIAEKVELAVTRMVDGIVSVVHTVVDSVVEAANAVASFFEQLGIMIMKVIEFLRALFNWEAILATKNIISKVFEMSIDSAKKAMLPAAIEAALRPLVEATSVRPLIGGASINGESATAGEASSPALDEARGVQGQMVMQKARENSITTTKSEAGPAQGGGSANPLEELILGIPTVLPGMLDLSLSDMVDKLMTLVTRGMAASVDLMIKGLCEMSSALVKGVEWVMKILQTEIRIPFLSELYRWITGSALTLLDLICLALAVPVHVAHLAVTTLAGNTRTFAEDNRNLVTRLAARAEGKAPPRVLRKTAGGNKVLLAAKRPDRMDTSAETLFIVLRSINLASGIVSDAMFTKTVSAGGIAAASTVEARARGLVKVIKGASGIAASYVQTFDSTPNFEKRMQSGMSPEAWEGYKPKPWIGYTIFGVLVLGDVITFVGGAKQIFAPPEPGYLDGISPGISGGSIDKAEYSVARWAAVGMIGLIVARIVFHVSDMRKLDEADADYNLKMMVKLYFVRDICMIVARMPWFMFTQEGANAIRAKMGGGASTFYTITTGLRAAAGGTALLMHVLAAYDYGQKP